MDEYLDIRMQEANKENDPQQQIEEAVFKQAYIPQRLTHNHIIIDCYKCMQCVVNVERDINLVKSEIDLIYKTLIGLKADLCKPAEAPEILADKHKKDKNTEKESVTCSSFEDSDNSDSENDSETKSEDNKSKFINSARPRNESPDSKKIRCYFFFCIV